MIRAESYFQTPGMSCPREMRPVPMAPTLIRLLGAVAPKTEAGTIEGKPRTVVAPTPWAAMPRAFRREISVRRFSVMGFLREDGRQTPVPGVFATKYAPAQASVPSSCGPRPPRPDVKIPTDPFGGR
jgi:hypothetical protein